MNFDTNYMTSFDPYLIYKPLSLIALLKGEPNKSTPLLNTDPLTSRICNIHTILSLLWSWIALNTINPLQFNPIIKQKSSEPH